MFCLPPPIAARGESLFVSLMSIRRALSACDMPRQNIGRNRHLAKTRDSVTACRRKQKTSNQIGYRALRTMVVGQGFEPWKTLVSRFTVCPR